MPWVIKHGNDLASNHVLGLKNSVGLSIENKHLLGSQKIDCYPNKPLPKDCWSSHTVSYDI